MSTPNGTIPFAQPDLDGAELRQVSDVLQSGWVTTGHKTHQFEAEFAAAVGAKYAVAVNSCTAAMHLALEAIGLRQGDEVITTPYTFTATAEVVRYFDAKPVLVDVHPRCLNIDPTQIEAAITPRTRAIIPVHIAGLPCDLNAVYTIAAKHNLAVIEDAAHAFPSRYEGRMIGQPPVHDIAQHATCFSFYATKTITTGEGGMICTDNQALAERCRIMALHGISKDAWKRYTAEGSWYYEVIAPGYKYNMTDIAAAIGLAQLAKAERMWARRRQIAHQYTQAFAAMSALQVPHDRSDHQHAWHLYMLRLNPQYFLDQQLPGHTHEKAVSDLRAEFIIQMKERGICTSVHFIPLHVHPYYRDTYAYQPQDFPVAYGEYQREVSLPIYSKMSDQDVQTVIAAVLDIVEIYAR